MDLIRSVEQLEQAEELDGAADAVQRLLQPVVGHPGPLKDALSGTWLGHPAHPMVVLLPIGSWLSAALVDLLGGRSGQRAAQRLVGMGVLAALPAALSGASDWSDTSGAERRVGLVHAAANSTALGLMTASWLARRRGRRATGTALALAGTTVTVAAGYLGGHLTYNQGVGVNTTAFQSGPQDWTPVGDAASVTEGAATGVDADGVQLLLTRHRGQVRAIAARCTHRGGPLHEGEVHEGQVTCPWHGSTFSVDDGSVVRGPASVPQAPYEVREVDGRVEVRRQEARPLRTGPV